MQNQNLQNLTQIVSTSNALKRPQDNIQPKMAVTRTLSNILPSGTAAIRPGSSVSTQTTSAVQMSQMVQKSQVRFNRIILSVFIFIFIFYLMFTYVLQPKVRPKTSVVNRSNMAAQKSDAANQTKPQLPQQHIQAQNK